MANNEERLAAKAKALNLELLPLDKTKEEAGKLLLSGWRMTQQTCPISEYPLFEKAGGLFSVRLGLPVQVNDDDDAAKPARHAAGNGHDATTNDDDDDLPAPRSEDPGNDVISKRIGEKLLLGWALLEDTCPITHACPLMRDPASGRLWTPALGEFVDEARGNDASAVQRDLLDNNDWVCRECDAVNPHGAECAQCKAAVSKRIGNKLMLGWEMLAEDCATGRCPLMRDPASGRLWSAALNDFVPAKAKAKATATATAAGAAVTTAATRAPVAAMSEDAFKQVVQRKMAQWATRLEREDDLDACAKLLGLLQSAHATLNML